MFTGKLFSAASSFPEAQKARYENKQECAVLTNESLEMDFKACFLFPDLAFTLSLRNT